jgi:hypothetical protein
MGSIAMDHNGNMALGYSASNGTSTYPSSWYTGRLATDALGTMPQGEESIIDGTGSQTGSQRWGDYTAMTVDPVDDCTFWYVNEYLPTTSSTGWRLRIGSFKFPSCAKAADFTLTADPTFQSICAPDQPVYGLELGSTQGYTQPVTLAAYNYPVGTMPVFTPNPATPGGTAQMTISDTLAGAWGNYAIDVVGTTVTQVHTATVGLELFTALPLGPMQTYPAAESREIPLRPTFTWQAAEQGKTYNIQVATDAGFTNIVASTTGLLTTSYTPGVDLAANTVYYWRVWATNTCGEGAYSAPARFLTTAGAGVCALGSTATLLYTQDFETTAPTGWAHGGVLDSWARSSTRKHGGSYSFKATDVTSISNQWLTSAPLTLPAGLTGLSLKYWNYQNIENRTGGCNDGGILEVTTDGGATWTQIVDQLLTDPYDGPINSATNPLNGLQAWCGKPQNWLNTIVSLDQFAGQTVQFRFRLGTNSSVGVEGWYIDDLAVQSCALNAHLGPDSSQLGLPGQTVTHTITLTNTGPTDTYNLALSGNAWAATIVGSEVVTMTQGQVYDIQVRVTIPAGASSDDFTLTVTSVNVPGLVLEAQGTTLAITGVFLPLVVRNH